jgi:hypothetical protein
VIDEFNHHRFTKKLDFKAENSNLGGEKNKEFHEDIVNSPMIISTSSSSFDVTKFGMRKFHWST